MRGPIYLDYAATSAVRPREVVDAITAYVKDVGATPGRSGHSRSLAAGRVAFRCRKLLSKLLGHRGDPGRITFHLNATHALNCAIFGTVNPGDRVVRTNLDHNAVRRPVAALTRYGITEEIVTVDASGETDLDRFGRLLEAGETAARLVVLPHASNVTGAVLPIRSLADIAHQHGAFVLLDAAQTVGHYPVDVEALGVDLVAFSGHKGLCGPQGTGGLWVREGVDVQPTIFGGTGGDSSPAEMPDAYPDHLEAGTQNAPGIAGLAAAAEWVLAQGVGERRAREQALKASLVEGLRKVHGVTILSSIRPESVGIVTLLVDGIEPAALAVRLEKEHGIQARAGLHCAPGAHETIGTLKSGALRLSIGWATTEQEIDSVVKAFHQLQQGSA